MSRATKFIELQNKANAEIETLGQSTEETTTALITLGDSLTQDEITEAISIHKQS